MSNILINRAKCLKCGDIITSEHRHDFRYCGCRSIAVDGGREYLRRLGHPYDMEDMSEFDEDNGAKPF